MQRAMILAAGFGTRLRPLTDECPKPLVPVGDRPLLRHVTSGLVQQGISEIALNLHYKSDKFSSVFNGLGASLHLLHEAVIRGTAGGIAGAREVLGAGPLVVVNGDILCCPPIEQLRRVDDEGLTLVIERAPRGMGPVGIDASGAVVRLRDKSFAPEASGARYVGVARLGKRSLERLPEQGCLIGDFAIPELLRGERIETLELPGEWLDVGSLGAYLEANLKWLDEIARPSLGWFDRSGFKSILGEKKSFIGEGVQLDPRVVLERSVVGAGATVEGQGAVVRSVLWPGARARAPLSDVVVTGSGRVVSCLESTSDLR